MLIVFVSTVFHELILRAPVCPEEPTPEIGQDQRCGVVACLFH
jgi:hypothetical protein